MKSINLKQEIQGNFDEVISQVTESLKAEGFGILTRIDLHLKFKEKLGKEIQPATILGACNPELAYEAYQRASDVAGLLPCNAVVRQLRPGTCSVELVKPTAMMEILGDSSLVALAKDADQKLERCLDQLSARSAA